MELPVQKADTEAKARGYIREAIQNAEPVLELQPPQDPSDPDPVPVPTGISRGKVLVPGPDFPLTMRWVVDFTVTLYAGSAITIPTRIPLIFEAQQITLIFDLTEFSIQVEFPTPEPAPA